MIVGKVNGFDVPKPLNSKPSGAHYFLIDPSSSRGYRMATYYGSEIDLIRTLNGMCYDKEEDAKAFVEAFRGYKVKGKKHNVKEP